MGTPVHGKNFISTWNSVTICADKASLSAEVSEADVTTNCDAEGVFLQGKPRFKVDMSGPTDYADNGGDETLWNGLTGGGAGVALRPDDGAISATNPEYQASAFVTSYKVDFGDDAARFAAAFRITGAVTRDVTP